MQLTENATVLEKEVNTKSVDDMQLNLESEISNLQSAHEQVVRKQEMQISGEYLFTNKEPLSNRSLSNLPLTFSRIGRDN